MLTDTLSSKDNQTMKFGQLIDNMKNIFAQRLYRKCDGVTILKTTFLKNQN